MAVTISKSRFVSGCQCLKRLYFQVYQPELASPEGDASDEATMEQGRKVGRLAHRLFPGGIKVDGSGIAEAIQITKELVSNPEVPAIFEGAFHYQGVVVKTDVLRRKENRWRLIEVKSTTDLKEHHTEDVAIQAYAVSRSGLRLCWRRDRSSPVLSVSQSDAESAEPATDSCFAASGAISRSRTT